MKWFFLAGVMVTASLFGIEYQTEDVPATNQYVISDATYRVILTPRHRTTLSAQVPAAVTKITKKIGDSFKEGEILLQLDDTIFKAQEKRSQAHVEKGQALVAAQKQLYNDKIASLTELRTAESDLATAEAELAIASEAVKNCIFKAPYDGKIVAYNIEEWELAQVGDKLLDIVDDNVLIAKTLVLSKDLSRIKPGDTLTIKLDDTGETIKAEVSRVGAVIDPASSTVEVEADIDNKEGLFKSGSSGITILK